MKKVSCVTLYLILVITLNFTSVCAQQAIGPRMVLKDKEFDAKEVKEGTVIEHTFKVLNTGDSPLEIIKVNPG